MLVHYALYTSTKAYCPNDPSSVIRGVLSAAVVVACEMPSQRFSKKLESAAGTDQDSDDDTSDNRSHSQVHGLSATADCGVDVASHMRDIQHTSGNAACRETLHCQKRRKLLKAWVETSEEVLCTMSKSQMRVSPTRKISILSSATT